MSAHPPPLSRTLADLKIGCAAIVESVEREDSLGIRLQELGFVPGTTIRLIRKAPLGDPMEVELRGYHVSLRADEARSVILRSEPS